MHYFTCKKQAGVSPLLHEGGMWVGDVVFSVSAGHAVVGRPPHVPTGDPACHGGTLLWADGVYYPKAVGPLTQHAVYEDPRHSTNADFGSWSQRSDNTWKTDSSQIIMANTTCKRMGEAQHSSNITANGGNAPADLDAWVVVRGGKIDRRTAQMHRCAPARQIYHVGSSSGMATVSLRPREAVPRVQPPQPAL